MPSFFSKLNSSNAFICFPTIKNCHRKSVYEYLHSRFMTTSKRVQDRSSNKRIHDLEIVTEKWKIVSKVMAVVEILKKEPEMIIPVRNLEQHRSKLNLPKPHKVIDFIRKSPKIFELYEDHRGVVWCGLSSEGERLIEEEERLIEEHSDKAAEYVSRCLMMSVDRRLSIDKIANFRRDFGLPLDFRAKWVHRYPELFRVVKDGDAGEVLELVEWNPNWAITELEKNVLGEGALNEHKPGLLALPFPLKFPQNYKKVYRYGGKIDHFQKRSYLSPYADANELMAGSLEFDKRAVAIMHELLSFTLERRLVTDHLTHFRQEFKMPQKLMRLLLKHFGIFYVSERGKRFSVFLTDAYEGRELIERPPLVLWKEKLLSLVGYRGKKKRIPAFSDLSEMEGGNVIIGDDHEDMNMEFEPEPKETMSGLEDDIVGESDDMQTREVDRAVHGW